MIHVFNNPIDPSTMSEFEHLPPSDSSSPNNNDETLFETAANRLKNKRKQRISYTKDGRVLVNGAPAIAQEPINMWSTAIARSVTKQWRERCSDTIAAANANSTDVVRQDIVDNKADISSRLWQLMKKYVRNNKAVVWTIVATGTLLIFYYANYVLYH